MAAAVLILAGCVKQDAVWAPGDITFRPLIGHDTRAMESVPFPQDRTFNVWATDQNNGTYIDAEEISYGADGWVSSKKWPRYALEFVACWPVDLDVEFSPTKGLQLEGFDCSNGNVDILFAHGAEDDADDDVAVLSFDHILSRVDFRMTHSLPADMHVRLKKIELVGFASKGDYGTRKKGEWSVDAYDFSYVVYDAGETDGIDISTGTATYIGEEFYVIPQLCTTSLNVTYDLRYGRAGWVPQEETIKTIETIWEPSKHYTYTVNLRTDKMTHTTGISSWDDREKIR